MTEKLNGKPKKFTRINELRGKVSILDELIRGVKVKSIILNRMKKKYKLKKLDGLTPLKETLKQKTQLKTQTVCSYNVKELLARNRRDI